MVIRIAERPAAAPPAAKSAPLGFSKFIIDAQRETEILARLHAFIDGKSPKKCALTILAAIKAGLIIKPTFGALKQEFHEIGSRPNYAYYLSRPQNYSDEIAAIESAL